MFPRFLMRKSKLTDYCPGMNMGAQIARPIVMGFPSAFSKSKAVHPRDSVLVEITDRFRMAISEIPSNESYYVKKPTDGSLTQNRPKTHAFAALLEREKSQALEPPETDSEFSWRMTQFLIWPGGHSPALRRQADMGIAIRTSDDDLELLRTS